MAENRPKGKLYMLPVPIGNTEVYDVLPTYNKTIIDSLDYFIVENIRTARRFLSRAGINRPIDTLTFAELNEHTSPEDISKLIVPIINGQSAGMLSEAGVPGIADPGADIAALAHRNGIDVIPLVGPSSIILALMASGLNGQSFAFNGYLPVKQPERTRAIRFFEKRAQTEHQSQIFIEAPYRNAKLLDDFLSSCANTTKLTIAVDILDPTQFIHTKTIGEWRKAKPEINKRPAIFIIG